MKVIKPSIGRIVLFQIDKQSQEQAAIIAAVHSDTCVNLAIFDGNGKPMAGPPTSITLVQPGQEQPEQGYFCKWMPYQIENAAEDPRSDGQGHGPTETAAEAETETEAKEVETETQDSATEAENSETETETQEVEEKQAQQESQGGQHKAAPTDGADGNDSKKPEAKETKDKKPAKEPAKS